MWLIELFKSWSTLEIYTDGSSKQGVGSWAYVVSRRQKPIVEKSGRVRRASSNTMEFQAAIEALLSLRPNSNVTLFSDSKILIDTMNSKSGPRAHQDQINLLLLLSENHKVKWQWIKGHRGNKFNERCDELCTLALL